MDKEEKVDRIMEKIDKVFGPGTRCLGLRWRINFDKEFLKNTLLQISEEEIGELAHSISFFEMYMKPISRLLVTRPVAKNLHEIMREKAWSNLALLIIFSILETLSKGTDYERLEFTDFLKTKLPIKTEQEIEQISKEHGELHPHKTVKAISDFLRDNLSEEDVKDMKDKFQAKKQSEGEIVIDKLEDLIKHLWGPIRSSFLHERGFRSVYNESTIFALSDEDGIDIEIHRNLSISEFLFLVWKAIFRHFGYKGSIDNRFTDEEMDNRETVNGLEI